jgi:hypothetical protein
MFKRKSKVIERERAGWHLKFADYPGIVVSIWEGTDGVPVVEIETEFEPDEWNLRIRLNNKTVIGKYHPSATLEA